MEKLLQKEGWGKVVRPKKTSISKRKVSNLPNFKPQLDLVQSSGICYMLPDLVSCHPSNCTPAFCILLQPLIW